MTKRPPAPLDLVGGAENWKFPSFGAYAAQLRRQPPAVNAYALVGHMSLRVQALDHDVQRAAPDREAATMKQRAHEAPAEGARKRDVEGTSREQRGNRGG